MKNIFIAIIIILAAGAFDFLIAAGTVWIACKCFGFIFTWKIALGVWVILLFVHNFIKGFSKQ